MGALILLWGCNHQTQDDALRIYARASLDLRGTRPSSTEAEDILKHPQHLEDALQTLLDDPRVGWNIALQHSALWQTRSDATDVAQVDFAIDNESGYLRSAGEEPLRIFAWIADHNLPWSDIVRAKWTVVDPTLAARWPVDYPSDGSGWQQAHYTDGRPQAGILSSSGFWRRYTTTFNNANRGRVNALSRILFCEDYLDRPVEFDASVDLTNEDVVREAVRTNPSCQACHSTLDPMGAYLWGYYVEFSNNITDWAWYHPNREDFWETFEVPPGYYGQPGHTIDDLGLQMAADPRLIQCIVKRSYETMLQRSSTLDDFDTLTHHREAMLNGGATIKALYASLLQDPAYRRLDGDDATWKELSPDSYASALYDLTGWQFIADGHDVFSEDYFGLRALAGGGRATAGQLLEATPTMIAVQERLSLAAADYVAHADAADPSQARLFTLITFKESPNNDEDRIRQQIAALSLRVLSTRVDPQDDAVDQLFIIWQAVYLSKNDPIGAWAAVLAAVLRDPAFTVY